MKHSRFIAHLITRRRLMGAALSLALGWALATAVAMACVIWLDTSNWYSKKDDNGVSVIGTEGLGYAEQVARHQKSFESSRWISRGTAQAGLPFLMYRRSIERREFLGAYPIRTVIHDRPSRLSEGYLFSTTGAGRMGSPTILPVVPIWLGFIANTLIYGGVFFALGALLMRLLRYFKPPNPWLCSNCRYDLRGLSSKVCPECGKQAEGAS